MAIVKVVVEGKEIYTFEFKKVNQAKIHRLQHAFSEAKSALQNQPELNKPQAQQPHKSHPASRSPSDYSTTEGRYCRGSQSQKTTTPQVDVANISCGRFVSSSQPPKKPDRLNSGSTNFSLSPSQHTLRKTSSENRCYPTDHFEEQTLAGGRSGLRANNEGHGSGF